MRKLYLKKPITQPKKVLEGLGSLIHVSLKQVFGDLAFVELCWAVQEAF